MPDPKQKYSVNELTTCLNYDSSPMPRVRACRLSDGQACDPDPRGNSIVFIFKGAIVCHFHDGTQRVYDKGKMVFLHTGALRGVNARRETQLLLFDLYEYNVRLCDNLSLEKLGEQSADLPLGDSSPGVLDIHPRLMQSLSCTMDGIADGIRCKRFFEIEIERFFLMLRLYYDRRELHRFMSNIITGDLVFTEHVRRNWMKYNSVKDLADSMSLTPKYFTRKFRRFFGQNPHHWMAENRARHLYGELTSTKKPLKQIAAENGFGSFQQLAMFTKKMSGKTPTEIRAGREK
jgi:AraC-like DNA-binding protein